MTASDHRSMSKIGWACDRDGVWSVWTDSAGGLWSPGDGGEWMDVLSGVTVSHDREEMEARFLRGEWL